MFNVLGALIFGQVRLVDGLQIRWLIQSLLGSQAVWIESLMIVGLGLLVARQHGVLAILFVVGGYSYIFLDTDYLYSYPLRDWSGLPLYLVALSFLVLVLMPIAFLRVRTKLARALVLFIPAVLFLAGRLIVPVLVTGQSLAWLMPGDISISINLFLSLILAWFLYSHTGRSAGKLSPPIEAHHL